MADDDVAVYGHLAALDADGDGEISRDEYRKAHETDRDQGLKAKAPKLATRSMSFLERRAERLTEALEDAEHDKTDADELLTGAYRLPTMRFVDDSLKLDGISDHGTFMERRAHLQNHARKKAAAIERKIEIHQRKQKEVEFELGLRQPRTKGTWQGEVVATAQVPVSPIGIARWPSKANFEWVEGAGGDWEYLDSKAANKPAEAAATTARLPKALQNTLAPLEMSSPLPGGGGGAAAMDSPRSPRTPANKNLPPAEAAARAEAAVDAARADLEEAEKLMTFAFRCPPQNDLFFKMSSEGIANGGEMSSPKDPINDYTYPAGKNIMMRHTRANYPRMLEKMQIHADAKVRRSKRRLARREMRAAEMRAKLLLL